MKFSNNSFSKYKHIKLIFSVLTFVEKKKKKNTDIKICNVILLLFYGTPNQILFVFFFLTARGYPCESANYIRFCKCTIIE